MSEKTKHSRKSASKQSSAIKFIAPHIERAQRVKELFNNNNKTSYIVAIKDDDENIIVDSCSKSPTEHMQIFTHIFKSHPSTAKLKAVTELLKMIETTNRQTFLGSPTFSEEEMKELKAINSRLEEILYDAVVR